MEKNLKMEPVQSLWIGGQLSKVEQLCIKSFLDNGHDFHLYIYEEIKNIPHGTTIFDANSIISEEKIFRYQSGWATGSVSGFADLFRLLLVQKNGGWWVDMDIICLKPLNLKQDTVICSSYESKYGSLVNNCVFKVDKESPFLKYCIDQISSIDLKNMDFGLAGPFLFQKAIKELKMENDVVPYHYFNPISWKYVNELILGNTSKFNKVKETIRPLFKPDTMHGRRIKLDSYTIHFWNEVWKAGNFDKNQTYPLNCLFEQLKRKHNIK